MQPDMLSQSFEHAIVEVAPKTAAQWLETQFGGQRRLREHHVLLLAQEMEAGTFIPHSSIVFADYNGDSYLIDGQHRLKAIIKYGRPVKMPVLRRKAESMRQVQEWYSSIDQGLKRSASDAIRAQNLAGELSLGERQAARVSAAVKLIATGFLDTTAGLGATKQGRIRARSNAVVSGLIRNWASEARTYFSLIQGGEQSTIHLFERASVMACGLLTLRYCPEEAQKFWEGAARDDGLTRHDARKRFLIWLRDSREKPDDVARAFAIVWRAFLDGGEIKLIRFDPKKPLAIRFVPLQNEIIGAAELTGEAAESPADAPITESLMNIAPADSAIIGQSQEHRAGEAGVHTQPPASA